MKNIWIVICKIPFLELGSIKSQTIQLKSLNPFYLNLTHFFFSIWFLHNLVGTKTTSTNLISQLQTLLTLSCFIEFKNLFGIIAQYHLGWDHFITSTCLGVNTSGLGTPLLVGTKYLEQGPTWLHPYMIDLETIVMISLQRKGFRITQHSVVRFEVILTNRLCTCYAPFYPFLSWINRA